MRTAIIICVGFIVWGACLGVARVLGGGSVPALIRATRTFVDLLVHGRGHQHVGRRHAGGLCGERRTADLPVDIRRAGDSLHSRSSRAAETTHSTAAMNI